MMTFRPGQIVTVTTRITGILLGRARITQQLDANNFRVVLLDGIDDSGEPVIQSWRVSHRSELRAVR